MIWLAYHGRPLVVDGHTHGMSEVFRETTFSAGDKDEAIRICDAIGTEVLAEYGPPVVAVLDTEEGWKQAGE